MNNLPEDKVIDSTQMASELLSVLDYADAFIFSAYYVSGVFSGFSSLLNKAVYECDNGHAATLQLVVHLPRCSTYRALTMRCVGVRVSSISNSCRELRLSAIVDPQWSTLFLNANQSDYVVCERLSYGNGQCLFNGMHDNEPIWHNVHPHEG